MCPYGVQRRDLLGGSNADLGQSSAEQQDLSFHWGPSGRLSVLRELIHDSFNARVSGCVQGCAPCWYSASGGSDGRSGQRDGGSRRNGEREDAAGGSCQRGRGALGGNRASGYPVRGTEAGKGHHPLLSKCAALLGTARRAAGHL